MSNQQNDSSLQDKLENLNSHLVMIRSLKESEAEIQYYNLLEKAKQIFGDLSPYMAKFYYEYGSYLLIKVQSSMDLFERAAAPAGQEDEGIAEYDSAYEDQDQDGAIPQKVQKTEQKTQKNQQKVGQLEDHEQKVLYEDDNVQITENYNEKVEQKQPEAEKDKTENEEQFTDLEFAYENLQVSLNIYSKQQQKLQKGEPSVIPKQDIFKYILYSHLKLGELYMFDQKFQDAINEYNIAIKMARSEGKAEMRRRASEAYYNIGNCLLHLNKQGCQIQAIQEYISSHEELLKYIEEMQKYDTSKIQVPTMQKLKVDRFGYLYKPLDSDLVKDIKDVMSLLLDKIEDTALQIETRPSFEREKAKMNQLRENNVFKEVSKDVKVTNLGTFGNRKKSQPPSILEKTQEKSENKEPTLNSESDVIVCEKKQGEGQTKDQKFGGADI